jgi:hypothetical protein
MPAAAALNALKAQPFLTHEADHGKASEILHQLDLVGAFDTVYLTWEAWVAAITAIWSRMADSNLVRLPSDFFVEREGYAARAAVPPAEVAFLLSTSIGALSEADALVSSDPSHHTLARAFLLAGSNAAKKRKGAAAKGAAVKGPKPKPKPKPKPTPCETEPQEEEDEKEHSDGHFSVHDDSADDDSSDDTEADEEAEYTVERIVAERTKADGKKEYKIKWKGYTLQTWEPEKNILDRSVLDEFDAVKAAKVSISPHALFRPPALTDVGCVVSVQVAKASKPLQPAPEPTPEPTPVMAVRMAKVVADQPVSLRVRATTDANAKDFNGAVVSSPDEVEILASEDKEGSTFYYIKAGRKKGFIKAAYVQEISAVLCAEI